MPNLMVLSLSEYFIKIEQNQVGDVGFEKLCKGNWPHLRILMLSTLSNIRIELYYMQGSGSCQKGLFFGLTRMFSQWQLHREWRCSGADEVQVAFLKKTEFMWECDGYSSESSQIKVSLASQTCSFPWTSGSQYRSDCCDSAQNKITVRSLRLLFMAKRNTLRDVGFCKFGCLGRERSYG